MKTKGFTLVELLVVIAILAILATVSVVGYTSFIDRANQSNSDTEAHQIESAIESYTIAGQVYELGTVSGTTYYVVADKGVCTATTANNVTTYTAITAAVSFAKTDLNEDLAGLTGTLKADSAKTLTYTYSEGITTTITLD